MKHFIESFHQFHIKNDSVVLHNIERAAKLLIVIYSNTEKMVINMGEFAARKVILKEKNLDPRPKSRPKF